MVKSGNILKIKKRKKHTEMKRYCQTLRLKDDPELISGYREAHAAVWPEIKAGMKEVGILDMEIYQKGTELFMIMETEDWFDWERDNARLSELPRQKEWEAYVSRFQEADPSSPSHEKWHLMERIFKL